MVDGIPQNNRACLWGRAGAGEARCRGGVSNGSLLRGRPLSRKRVALRAERLNGKVRADVDGVDGVVGAMRVAPHCVVEPRRLVR